MLAVWNKVSYWKPCHFLNGFEKFDSFLSGAVLSEVSINYLSKPCSREQAESKTLYKLNWSNNVYKYTQIMQ